MFDKLNEVEKRFDQLSERLSSPEVIGDKNLVQKLAREHKEILGVVEAYRKYKDLAAQLEDARLLLEDADPDLRQLAKEEMSSLEGQVEVAEQELKLLLLPKDPNDDKNVFLEIRAGTGGDEAALFAATLFRMYARFAERRRWRMEIVSQHLTEIGGFKEVIALVEGVNVYSHLKFEGGVHRVQRVPSTESQGRIHTSTATVAVLPEVDEVDIQIDEKDLQVDVYRSSGPGGQSVNTTDSAVRVTHLPTGMVVTCQDEKSQHKNKAKALRVLRARLMDQTQAKQQAEICQARRSMVGSGERSEKIRTYNFPQNRVTDHRIGLTLHRLEYMLDGDINDLIVALRTSYQAEALKA